MVRTSCLYRRTKLNLSQVSMSTTFYPREDHPTDLIILTSDNVFFSVHCAVLLEKSSNQMAGLLAVPDVQSITSESL